MPRRRSRSRSARPTLPRFAKSCYARRLRAEQLEDRRMLATLVVQNNLDGDLATLAGDGELSLREAIHIANTGATIDGFTSADAADTIEFDPAAFTGGAASLVRLIAGELEITDTLTIDGSTGVDVTITGDAAGDDIVDANFITDVAASFVDDSFNPSIDLLDDNSRVINFTANSGDLTLAESTITGGRTIWDGDRSSITPSQNGGGIRFLSGGVLTLASSVVGGNSIGPADPFGSSSRYAGGGVYSHFGDLVVNNSTISGNSINTNTSDLVFVLGGGLSTRYGDITVADSTVSGNSVSGRRGSANAGGGIGTVSGAVTLSNSTVQGNYASTQGGGIFSASGPVVIDNSTVSGNSATFVGGGIGSTRSDVTVTNSTVAHNASDFGGSGLNVRTIGEAPTLTVRNSILSGGTTIAGEPAADLAFHEGTTPDISYSLIGHNIDERLAAAPVGTPDLNGNLIGTQDDPIDPLLRPLADNGGLTLTHALLPGSPAIDVGNSASSADQRGRIRPVDLISVSNGSGNASDIGAFEFFAPAETVLPTNLELFFETPSEIDLTTGGLIIEESGESTTLKLAVSGGSFFDPTDGSAIGVTATLLDPQTITLEGTAADLNRYLDTTSHLLYSPASGAVGAGAETITVTVGVSFTGTVPLDILEIPDLVVSTTADTIDPFDLATSLREAINLANNTSGADIITFDPAVFTGGTASLIRLTQGELQITETLTVDGATGAEIVISGDAFGNDQVLPGTLITDVDASIASDPTLLNDNSRLFHFLDATGLSEASGDLTLNSLTLTGGRIQDRLEDGGGILFDSDGLLLLSNSLVSGNSTEGEFSRGGALYASSGSTRLVNTTVSGNRSSDRGGGISTFAGDVALIHSTVTDNTSVRGGGGISLSSGLRRGPSLTLHNSVVASNTSESAPDVQLDNQNPRSVEYSLIGDTTGSGVTATTGTGNLLNVDPLLGPLADNGGPTLTHAPLPGSPLIDAGDPNFVTTTGVDQRGNPFARVVGGRVDIGAVESQPTPTRAVGDYNGDNLVNAADYAVWRNALDPTTPVTPLSGADGDGDGFVTANDFEVWRSHFGFRFTPPEATVAIAAPPALSQSLLRESDSRETRVDAAFALLASQGVPEAPSQLPRTESRSEAPLQDDALLLFDLAPAGQLFEPAERDFDLEETEEEPSRNEALANAISVFE